MIGYFADPICLRMFLKYWILVLVVALCKSVVLNRAISKLATIFTYNTWSLLTGNFPYWPWVHKQYLNYEIVNSCSSRNNSWGANGTFLLLIKDHSYVSYVIIPTEVIQHFKSEIVSVLNYYLSQKSKVIENDKSDHLLMLNCNTPSNYA